MFGKIVGMREKYLDGLRGWAAVAVVLHHLGLVLWPKWAPGFQLPFSDGSFAVFIFFVLSGYVLSIGFFRTQDSRVVVDLALRRYLRLTIPILGVSMLALILMKLGLLWNLPAAKAAGSEDWLGVFYGFAPSAEGAFNFAAWRVYIDANSATSYNSSLWTMPIEMGGSIMVFAFLLILGHVRSLQFCGYLVLLATSAWFASPLFGMAAGMAVGHYSVTRAHFHLLASPYASAVGWLLLLAGVMTAALRPASFSPVLLTLCSVAVVYSVLINKGFQELLNRPISRWLGRISFSLYLVHLLVICSFTSWAYLAVGEGERLDVADSAAVLVASVLLSLSAAAVFYPIEKAGISVARHFSQIVLRIAQSGRLRTR